MRVLTIEDPSKQDPRLPDRDAASLERADAGTPDRGERPVRSDPKGAPTNSGGAALRVLIVDDEDDIRVLLRNQLERAGYEVVGEAADGAEAIALCEATKPDAVILDLLMPRMNGFEAIPKLFTKHPKVRIVAYSAVAGDFVRQEMLRLGIPLVLKSGQFSRLDAVLRDLGRGADG